MHRVKYIPYKMSIAKREFLKIAYTILGPEGGEYIIDSSNEGVIEDLIRYVHADPDFNGDPKKGIALLGGTGTGKTLLIKILNRYRAIDDVCYYVNGRKKHFWFDIADSSKIVADFEVFKHDSGRLQQYINTNCLTIDDLGKERQEIVYYGNRINIIREILNARHRDKALTHITSNLSLQQIAQIYGDEIESRMYEMFHIFSLSGPDRRKKS